MSPQNIILLSVNLEDYVSHAFSDHPVFHALWSQIDLHNGRLVIPAPAKLSLNGRTVTSLEHELRDQYDDLVNNCPNWELLIDRFEGDTNVQHDVLGRMRFKKAVYHAGLMKRMLTVCKDSGLISARFPLYEKGLATAGFVEGMILGFQGHFRAARQSMEDAVDFVNEGVASKIIQYDDDDYDLDEYGLPNPESLARVYLNVKRQEGKQTEHVDLDFEGLPGSLQVQYDSAMESDDFETLGELVPLIQQKVALPLRELNNNLQLYTAGRLLALYFFSEPPEIEETENGFAMYGREASFELYANQQLKIYAEEQHIGKVLSVLHKPGYALVFPRFQWQIEEI